MPSRIPRRPFLGGTAAMLGLAGCQQSPDSRPVDTTAERTDETRNTTDGETTSSTTFSAGPGTARFVVGKRQGRTVSLDGRTGAVLYSAPAGEDDARVIQRTFDELPDGGGSVFFENGVYEIGRFDQWSAGIKLHTNNVVISSDFARLRFHEHSPGDDIKKDFAVHAVENVLLQGLIIDGNREERTSPTRTLDIANASNVTVRDCVILGGRRIEHEGGAGYGIGPFQTSHLTVTNCLVRDSDRHGIHPGGNEGIYRDFRIVGNAFVNNAHNPTGAAIDIRDRTADVLVSNNYVAENGNGIRVKGSQTDNVRISNNLLRDNANDEQPSSQVEIVAEGFGSHSIRSNRLELSTAGGGTETRNVLLDSEGDCESLELRANEAVGGDYFLEARVNGTLSYLDVTGNTMAGMRRGVVVEGTDAALVKDNVVRRATEVGIGGSRAGGMVVDNVLQDADVDGGLAQEGFEVEGNRTL